VFQAFTGLVAIVNDQSLVPTREYLFQFDRTTWGWIHLVLGLVIAGAGVGLLGRSDLGAGRPRSGGAGQRRGHVRVPASLPLWALLVIALDVAVIWAVATQGGLGGTDR
jgi:hypothetical protein